MSAPVNRLATGILPDSVIRTPDANATLLSVALSEQLTNETVKAWLINVTELVSTLEGTVEDGRVDRSQTQAGTTPRPFFQSERFGPAKSCISLHQHLSHRRHARRQ